jgi:hypothetical protein
MAPPWADDPVSPNTPIRAVHINELRSTVNTLRGAAGLISFLWTDRTASGDLPTSAPIRAVHFTDLYGAIQDLWLRKRMGKLPNGTVGQAPRPGRPISRHDMSDLRNWVNEYADSPGNVDPAGLVSLAFDPAASDGHGVVVGADWRQDAIDLKPDGERLLIRATVVAQNRPGIDYDSVNGAMYAQAVDVWRSVIGGKRFEIGLVLPAEFYLASGANDELSEDGQGMSNAYIDEFVNRAATFASYVIPRGASTFWIWNEPQVNIVQSGKPQILRKDLAPENFASLVYRSALALRDAGAENIYVGSLHILPYVTGTDSQNPHLRLYLRKMYNHLRNSTNNVQSYPWTSFSINMENELTDTAYPQSVRQAIINEAIAAGDSTRSIILGEWGLRPDDFDTSSDLETALNETYSNIVETFPTLYFFTHEVQVEGYGLRNIKDPDSYVSPWEFKKLSQDWHEGCIAC